MPVSKGVAAERGSLTAFVGGSEYGVAAGRMLQDINNKIHHMTEVRVMSVEVKAPMPGKILEVLVSAGDQVKEDDELVMLEAMKMENPIYAPADGTVKEIKVKTGDSVETDQVMVVLE
jgi:acetyl-CoA carboxylase biotin carboxyl carrier protein